jgi:hypothetical protein
MIQKSDTPAPSFPLPIKINERWYWLRSGLEAYKCAMIGLPPPPRSDTDIAVLVTAKVVAQEFGVGRRTLGRRIVAAVAAAELVASAEVQS